jgi:superfamily II DNA/RNA helicase
MLVATDVAARGIDVDDITHAGKITNYLDNQPHTHRSRTGRAGKTGILWSLFLKKVRFER